MPAGSCASASCFARASSRSRRKAALASLTARSLFSLDWFGTGLRDRAWSSRIKSDENPGITLPCRHSASVSRGTSYDGEGARGLTVCELNVLAIDGVAAAVPRECTRRFGDHIAVLVRQRQQ